MSEPAHAESTTFAVEHDDHPDHDEPGPTPPGALPSTGRPGEELPEMRAHPPGPESRSWQLRMAQRQAPMGPRPAPDAPPSSIVLSRGAGANVFDVDENRYVDLAAGFGALLLGHSHPGVLRAIQLQSERLLQALGDVYPSDAKVGLLERLGQLLPIPEAQIILGQSGADAVSAALKTAALATGKPGVLAFQGSYHGLSYGPLATTDLRPSYREPFREQLSPHVRFALYPSSPAELDESLDMARQLLAERPVGAILVEPLLGRGGVIDPPAGFLRGLWELAREAGALLIADEIWTGLGRAGDWLASSADGVVPDLVCLGKGLGGGLPISACVGTRSLMSTWSREHEVVHTSTFAGAPLAAATALATLDALGRGGLLRRGAELGARWKTRLELRLRGTAITEVRGRGMMLGLDAGELPGGAWALQKSLLARGFVTSTGGGKRDVLVLTPPLIVTERQLEAFDDALIEALG